MKTAWRIFVAISIILIILLLLGIFLKLSGGRRGLVPWRKLAPYGRPKQQIPSKPTTPSPSKPSGEAEIPTGSATIPIAIQLDEKAASFDDSDLRDLASKYQAISDRMAGFSPAQIKRLHELNSNIIVAKYINFSSVFENSNLTQEHPDWVLKDPSGRQVPAIWGAGAGATMDPANTGWRSYLVNQSYKAVTEGGYDGVMADVVLMANRLPQRFAGVNPKTGNIYTTEEWRNAQYDTLKAVKTKIGSNKYLIANNVRFGQAYFQEGSSRFLEVTDGVVAEDFRGLQRWPLTMFPTEEIWKLNVEMMIDVQARGKKIIADSKFNKEVVTNEKEKEQYDRFVFSTFLLGKGDNSYFSSVILDRMNIAKSDKSFNPMWQTPIGSPLNTYYKKDGVYQRDFSSGKVLVNPTDNSYTINLNDAYKDLDGKSVTSLTINPHQGVILTK